MGVRLHRWCCSAGGKGSGGSGDGEKSRLAVGHGREASPGALVVAGTGDHAVSSADSEGVPRGGLSAVPWLEREGERAREFRGGGGTDVISGDPPPTLKLELICVQESDRDDDCDSKKGASAEQDTAGVPSGIEDNPDHHSVDGAGRGDEGLGGKGGHRLRRSDSSSSSVGRSASCRTGATSPRSSTSGGNSDSGRKASVNISTPNEPPRNRHRWDSAPTVHQCEVTWCGRPVGGTSAPPAGLPVPRWEGQVFYLPLSAADTSSGGATETPTDDACTDGQSGGRRAGYPLSADSGLLQSPPPLLAVTLNRSGGVCLYPRMIGTFLRVLVSNVIMCVLYTMTIWACNSRGSISCGKITDVLLCAFWITTCDCPKQIPGITKLA